MVKKLAVLALALAWLIGAPMPSAECKTSHSGSKSAVNRPSARRSVRSKTSKARRASHRRRVRRRSPWRVSSFGDPGAQDDPSGDDPIVRQTVLEALGNWNGSAVVVDPNNGRILSIVNQKLALESAFTPCSTFKPVVALAALKEGIVSPETKLRVSRRTRMDLTEALARSNNSFFAKLGQMLGFRRLFQYARQFGLGQKAGLDIPDEVPCRFPVSPPKDGNLGLLASYGQTIEVTLLQMAAIASAIANGGTLYALQYPRAPEEVARFEPKVRRHLEGLAEHFPHIQEGLAAAVVYGTARLAYDPDEQIYGKTGTCSEDGARLGWFVSYANERQAKYVVVVLLRGGRLMYGPHAAEIAGRIYRELRLRERNATQAGRLIPKASDSSP